MRRAPREPSETSRRGTLCPPTGPAPGHPDRARQVSARTNIVETRPYQNLTASLSRRFVHDVTDFTRVPY